MIDGEEAIVPFSFVRKVQIDRKREKIVRKVRNSSVKK